MNQNFNSDDFAKRKGARVPLMFLLDTSGSMSGLAIRRLQMSINQFLTNLSMESSFDKIIDICVLGFNDEVYSVCDWSTPSEIENVALTAYGGTDLVEAITFAFEKMICYIETYNEYNCNPILVVVSDGYSGELDSIAKVIKEKSAGVDIFFFGVPGFDKETGLTIAGRKKLLELKDNNIDDYSEIFRKIVEVIREKTSVSSRMIA